MHKKGNIFPSNWTNRLTSSTYSDDREKNLRVDAEKRYARPLPHGRGERGGDLCGCKFAAAACIIYVRAGEGGGCQNDLGPLLHFSVAANDPALC